MTDVLNLDKRKVMMHFVTRTGDIRGKPLHVVNEAKDFHVIVANDVKYSKETAYLKTAKER